MRELTAGDFVVRGTSTAGVSTSIHVPRLKCVFDAGVAHPSFSKESDVFLSHCHMDHIGSLMALLGYRELYNRGETTVWVPTKVVPEVKALIDTACALGKFKSKPKVRGLDKTSDAVHYTKKGKMVAFNTHHAVPSNGYLFQATRNKLLPQFVGLPNTEIGELRKKGVEITGASDVDLFCYATDTTSGVWKTEPRMLSAEVLVMECTFLDDKVPVAGAQRHGHIHLDEIVENADLFKNKHIILMHFSARYSNSYVQKMMEEKLPPSLKERVQLLLPESAQ